MRQFLLLEQSSSFRIGIAHSQPAIAWTFKPPGRANGSRLWFDIRLPNARTLGGAHFRPIFLRVCQIARPIAPSSAVTPDQVEVVLELHQEHALALEDASGIGAVLVVAEDADVLQH